MSDDFRFSSDRFTHVNDKCCGKAGCTNTTDQCSLRRYHEWQIKRAEYLMRFGPRSYTQEQAQVIERAVAERQPLKDPPLQTS